MTISVNEQVAGHKVTVRLAGRAERGQRRARCACGWESRIGSTEQVMPEIRTHLDAALAGPLLWGPETTSPAVPTPRPGCIKGALCTSGTAGGGP